VISRSDIDDAVAGYIKGTLEGTYYGEEATRLSDDFGPGDIPKPALISMRRDVEAFLKRNEQLIRGSFFRATRYLHRAPWTINYTEEPFLEMFGWEGVGEAFSVVRNGDATSFDDLGWRPDEITEKLNAAAWAFPKTELYVGDAERGEEPGRLYFWTERKR
jgi:hypothetical protein